jgi:hypothetical protein
MFILQRPQLPKTGWSMPEPAPDPDGKKLLDSAIIKQDYNSLPGLCNIEMDMQTSDPVETPSQSESPAESIASEPPPSPESTVRPLADAAACNPMQHDLENSDDVAPAPRPVPPGVLKARNDHQKHIELLDMLN